MIQTNTYPIYRDLFENKADYPGLTPTAMLLYSFAVNKALFNDANDVLGSDGKVDETKLQDYLSHSNGYLVGKWYTEKEWRETFSIPYSTYMDALARLRDLDYLLIECNPKRFTTECKLKYTFKLHRRHYIKLANLFHLKIGLKPIMLYSVLMEKVAHFKSHKIYAVRGTIGKWFFGESDREITKLLGILEKHHLVDRARRSRTLYVYSRLDAKGIEAGTHVSLSEAEEMLYKLKQNEQQEQTPNTPRPYNEATDGW